MIENTDFQVSPEVGHVVDNEVMNNHFIECYPNEGVVFIVDGKTIPVENIHQDPQHFFKVDPKVYHKHIHGLQAIIHSHNHNTYDTIDARTPSPTDVNAQIKTGVPWGIVSVDGTACSEILWFPSSPNNKLLERPFIHCVFDCHDLIRSYYHQVLDVTLKDKPLGYNWAEKEEVPFVDWCESHEQLFEVDINSLEKNDILLFGILSSKSTHCGVYMGGDMFMHQGANQLSSIASLSRFKRYLTKGYRYGN